MRTSRQTQHIVGYIFNIVWRSYGGCHRRHLSDAAQCQSFFDLVGGSTVQPIPVRQIGKPFRASGVRAVALGAIVHKQALANGFDLRVFGKIFRLHRDKLCVQRCFCQIRFFNFRCVLIR